MPSDNLIGMVYIMTNAAGNNAVAAFRRTDGGALSPMNSYSTQGSGSGVRGVGPTPGNGVDPLQSQGSLALYRDGRFLFAVNAGSSSISSFRVSSDGSLSLTGVVPSGGAQPNCLCSFGNLLYAAYTGSSSDNFSSGVTGYTIGADGRLAVINGSTRSLSMPGVHPACATFSPDGRFLVVSELSANRLSVFGVGGNGMLFGPAVSVSNGRGPFGSCFLSSGLFLAAEAGSNALVSYRLDMNGALGAIDSSPNSQMATCWVVLSADERYAYTANAGSGTISAYNIDMDGTLRLLENVPVTSGGPMGAPIDSGVSRDGFNFYALNGNQGSISVFRIDSGGRLTLIQVLARTGLPMLGSQGMAVL